MTDQPKVTAESLSYLHETFDGAVWAKEFCRVTGFAEESWALVWFCNAIMAGYDHAKREAASSGVSAARLRDELIAIGSPTEDIVRWVERLIQKCERCDALTDSLQQLRERIEQLPLYAPDAYLYPGGVPGPAFMREGADGAYVKLSDVLKLLNHEVK